MEKLTNLVATLQEQHAQKADYVIPSQLLVMDGGRIISKQVARIYTPNEVFHEGLSDKLQIPLQYYRRMQNDRPELLDLSVNHWLQHQAGKNVLLRTFESTGSNIARAFLSDRYQAIDNYDILFAALEAIKSMGVKVEIMNADVTDRRLYLNVTCPEVEIEARKALEGYLTTRSGVGNGVISGFTVTNSEVGCGSFQIRPRAVILKCGNGMISPDDTFSRVHLGGKLEQGAISWSQDTRNKNLELVMSQLRDAIKTFLSPEYLGRMIEKIEKAAELKLDNPVDTVQNVCKELRFTEAQRRSILDHFVQGGDTHASGVAHAITRQAQDEDPDNRNDMELAAFAMLPKIKQFDKPFSGN